MRLDIERNLRPAAPCAVDKRAMIKARRLCKRMRDDVNGAGHGVRAGSGDEEMGDLVEVINVVERDLLEVVGCVLVLVHLLLKFLEDLSAVEALRLNKPVLRVEKDFPGGLPNPVPLHPTPPIPGVVQRIDLDTRRLEVHAAALDEDLH